MHRANTLGETQIPPPPGLSARSGQARPLTAHQWRHVTMAFTKLMILAAMLKVMALFGLRVRRPRAPAAARAGLAERHLPVPPRRASRPAGSRLKPVYIEPDAAVALLRQINAHWRVAYPPAAQAAAGPPIGDSAPPIMCAVRSTHRLRSPTPPVPTPPVLALAIGSTPRQHPAASGRPVFQKNRDTDIHSATPNSLPIRNENALGYSKHAWLPVPVVQPGSPR